MPCSAGEACARVFSAVSLVMPVVYCGHRQVTSSGPATANLIAVGTARNNAAGEAAREIAGASGDGITPIAALILVRWVRERQVGSILQSGAGAALKNIPDLENRGYGVEPDHLPPVQQGPKRIVAHHPFGSPRRMRMSGYLGRSPGAQALGQRIQIARQPSRGDRNESPGACTLPAGLDSVRRRIGSGRDIANRRARNRGDRLGIDSTDERPAIPGWMRNRQQEPPSPVLPGQRPKGHPQLDETASEIGDTPIPGPTSGANQSPGHWPTLV